MLPKFGNCLAKITELIKAKYDGQCGIVYCFSQMDCERCAQYLNVCRASPLGSTQVIRTTR